MYAHFQQDNQTHCAEIGVSSSELKIGGTFGVGCISDTLISIDSFTSRSHPISYLIFSCQSPPPFQLTTLSVGPSTLELWTLYRPKCCCVLHVSSHGLVLSFPRDDRKENVRLTNSVLFCLMICPMVLLNTNKNLRSIAICLYQQKSNVLVI